MIETVRTWALLRNLRSGVKRVPTRLRLLQDTLLRAAAIHAYENVPFYRRFWDEQGFVVDSVRGVQDLERIPVINGQVVREAVKRGELLTRNVDAAHCTIFPTSGSSGSPLYVWRRELERRLWRVALWRMLFEHGFRWRHSTVQFYPPPGPSHLLQRLGISRTTWIPHTLPINEQLATFVKARAHVVIGTPTALRRICRALEATGQELRKPWTVFCAGEVLDAETRGAVKRILGVDPVNTYGLTEVGHVAWQCEERGSLHVNADTHLVEVVRDGEAVRPGELGKIVVTDLHNRTMPFLRYDTGDLAVATTGLCPCGRQLPRLASIEGRLRTSILLKDGRILTTRAIVDHLAGVLRLNEYRLRQETTSRFRLELSSDAVQSRDCDGQSELQNKNTILGHLRGILGDVEISIETVGPFPECGEKTYSVVSDVPIPIG